MIVAGPQLAVAEVTAVGAVAPAPFPNGEPVGQLRVGAISSPDSGPFGAVTIDGGSTLEAFDVVIGADRDFIGDVDVTGAGSRLTTTGDLIVGAGGIGTLNVTDGGSVVTDNFFVTSRRFNGDSNGFGTVRVDGPRSFLAVDFLFDVGESGPGRLEVTNGGRVLVASFDNTLGAGTIVVAGPGSLLSFTDRGLSNTAGTLEIADGGQVLNATDNGLRTVVGALGQTATVSVTGDGSLWAISDSLSLGNAPQLGGSAGAGRLHVGSGAAVEVGGRPSGVGLLIGPTSEVRLAGGELRVRNAIRNSGLVTGGGAIAITGEPFGAPFNTFANESNGVLRVGEGETLRIDGDLRNAGAVLVDGGALDITRTTTQRGEGGGDQGPSTITAADGTLTFRGGLENGGGVLASVEGTNNIVGSVSHGEVLVTGGSHAIVHGSLLQSAVDVSPGATLTVLGDFMPADSLTVGLASDGAAITASGATQLGGELAVTLAAGAEVLPGERFELLSAGELVGEFSQVLLPEVDGVQLRLDIDATTIAVLAALAGDYNGDGAVDAADYTVWRDALASQDPAADGNGDGAVDTQDYRAWVDNFGAATPSPGAAAVPEPQAALLAASIGLPALCRRKRR